MSKILKGTSILTFGDIVSRSSEILRIIFITHVFSVGEFGVYSLATATVIIFMSFVLPIYPTVILRFFPHYEKQGHKKISEFFTSSLVLLIVNGVLMTGLIILGADLIGLYYQKPEIISLIKLAAPLAALLSLSNVLLNFLLASERFKWIFAQQFSGSLVNLFAVIGFTYAGFGIKGLIFAYILSELIKVAVPMFVLSTYLTWARPKLEKVVWVFWRPLLATMFFKIITNHLPTIIMGRFLDTFAIGLFNIVDRTINILLSFLDPYLSTLGAVAIRAYTKSRQTFLQIINRHNSFTAFISICWIGGAAIIFGPLGFQILYGDEFMGALPYYYIHTMAGVMGAMGMTFPRTIYSVHNKNSYYFYVNVIATIFLLITMTALVYLWGLWGLVLTISISRIFNLILHTYFSHKAEPKLSIFNIWGPLTLYSSLFLTGLGINYYLNIPVWINASLLTTIFVLTIHFSGFIRLPEFIKGIRNEFKQMTV